MSRSPRVTGSELIAALTRDGFQVIRVRGFSSPRGWGATVIPVHSGGTIGPGLFEQDPAR
jgi:predicted RNA binding protein YcfA (HicA-like mRNA interferase family)